MGEMRWLSESENGTKVLYLREKSYEPWKHYYLFQHLCIPDYQIPGGSKGYATMQKLLKAGWSYISSPGIDERGAGRI
jgi:hypothetical protein